jgi:hypothetical protein
LEDRSGISKYPVVKQPITASTDQHATEASLLANRADDKLDALQLAIIKTARLRCLQRRKNFP